MMNIKTKGYYLKRKNAKGSDRHLYIAFNEDGESVDVKNIDGETPKNIGLIINAMGGVAAFVDRAEPTSANFVQWQRWIKGILDPKSVVRIKREPKKVWEKVFSTNDF